MTSEDEAQPVPPLQRNSAAMLDGVIRCADCGELLRGAIDAAGEEFYVHESAFEDEPTVTGGQG